MSARFAIMITILGLAGCSPQQVPISTDKSSDQTQQFMTTKPPWHLTYYDGSGNTYLVRHNSDEAAIHFKYRPIQPAMSSSGVYSGGDPVECELNEDQTQDLWQQVRQMASDTSVHIEKRIMGSGAFSLSTPDGKQAFLIKNGPALQQFNDLMQQIRSTGSTP